MQKTKEPNLITPAIGATGGAIIGGATGILLSNKKARQKIASKIQDIRDYAEEAITNVTDMAQKEQFKNIRLAGVKGGKTKKRGRPSKS